MGGLEAILIPTRAASNLYQVRHKVSEVCLTKVGAWVAATAAVAHVSPYMLLLDPAARSHWAYGGLMA